MRSQTNPTVSQAPAMVALVALSKHLEPVEIEHFQEDEETIRRNKLAFEAAAKAFLRIRDERTYRVWFSSFEDYCRGRWGYGRRYVNQIIQAGEIREEIAASLEAGHRGAGKYEFPAASSEEAESSLSAATERRGGFKAGEEDVASGGRNGPGPKNDKSQSGGIRDPRPTIPLPKTESQARPLARLPKGKRAAAWREANEVAAKEGRPVTAKVVAEVVKQKVTKETKAGGFSQAELQGMDQELHNEAINNRINATDPEVDKLAQKIYTLAMKAAEISRTWKTAGAPIQAAMRAIARWHMDEVSKISRAPIAGVEGDRSPAENEVAPRGKRAAVRETRPSAKARPLDPTNFVVCRTQKGKREYLNTRSKWVADPNRAIWFYDEESARSRISVSGDNRRICQPVRLDKALKDWR